MPKPLIIAHRGDSSRALENSLEALRLALAIPVDMIEIDLRKSSDNAIYVMHDKNTGRTAEYDLDIEHSTSKQICDVKLKNGEAIPTLDDVLKLVDGKARLNLEIKSSGAGEITARRLLASGYKGYVLISSFHEEEVVAARSVMPEIPGSLIFDLLSPRGVPAYKAKGYRIASISRKAASEKLILACRKHGIKTYLWTVDTESEMKKFIACGVDGIYSNKPLVLKKVVESLRNRA